MVTAQNFAVGTVSRLSHARRSAVAKVASRPLLSGRSSHSRRAVVPVAASRRSDDTQHSIDGLMPETSSSPTSSGVELTKLDMAAAGLMGPLLMFVGDAAAADGQYGLLEGRSAALVHPIVMAALFGTTLYAGYLGFQWRRLREVSTEIGDKKKALPKKNEDGERPASPLDGEIKELEDVRKELSSGNFRDRHNDLGSALLGLGVLTSVGGALNTYLRVGKLFPGPHLFAGAGITVCWALAASLVPAMKKGDDTARSLHIALNTVNVALFAWQLPTGWEIVLKVFQFTSWP